MASRISDVGIASTPSPHLGRAAHSISTMLRKRNTLIAGHALSVKFHSPRVNQLLNYNRNVTSS